MNSRIVKAIFIAPLTVFPPMTLIAWSTGWAAPIIGFIAVAIAYGGMVVIGIPSILLLRRYQDPRWWQLTLAGAIGAAGPCWATGERLLSPTAIFAGAFGALVAAAAWFIAFHGLPSQSADSL